MQHQTLKYQLLAAILRKLKSEKKELGVGQHLQLQELVAGLPEDIPLEQLKVILSPLIAKNDQEQARFYTLFAEALAEVRLINEAWEAEEQISEQQVTQERQERRDRRWIGLVGMLLFASLLSYLILPYFTVAVQDPPGTIEQLATIQADTSFTFLLDTSRLDERILPFESVYFAKDSTTLADSSAFGNYQLSGVELSYASRDTTGFDQIAFIFEGPDSLKQQLVLQINVVSRPAPEATAVVDNEYAQLFQLRPENPVPTRDIAELEKKGLGKFQQWINDNRWWLRPTLTALSLLLLYLILRYRDRRRRQLVAEIEERDQPPYIWTLELDEVPEVQSPAIFGQLLRQLRRRTGEDHFELDVPRTIEATIDRGGMIDFRYRQQTRPPEYLLLIDRHRGDNHRARLFDWMYQQFKAQEVFVERFFFDGDPRLCKNEACPDGVRLGELQYKYPNARLLIFSQGYQMIDRRTGQLSKWVKDLERWDQRAVLSPRPLQDWGLKERALLSSFELMPATTQGLSYLVEQFDKLADRSDPSRWKNQLKDVAQFSVEIEEDRDIVQQLHWHYTADEVKWIASCAVYPALHWDLTLYLGDLVARDNRAGLLKEQFLTVDRISRLNQLPWFLQGKMPNEVRSQLVDWLSVQHPDLLSQIREELHQLFQRQNIPEGSIAYQEFQMNIALNEYAFTKDKKKKRQLKEEIAQKLEAGIEGDFTVIKTLEGQPGPLDLVIPQALRKYAYQGGYKGLGFRRSFWDILVGGLLFLLLNGAVWTFLQKQEDPCLNGNQVVYNYLTLCLQTKADSVLYFEYLTKDSLAAGNIAGAQRLVQQTRELVGVDVLNSFLDNNILLRLLIDSTGRVSPAETGDDNSVGLTTNIATNHLNSPWASYSRNIGRAFYNLGVEPANRADSLIIARDTLYQDIQDEACQLWQTALDLGESGIFRNFCSYDRIYIYIDPRLRNTSIDAELRTTLHNAGFSAYGLYFRATTGGNRVHYFRPEDRRVAQGVRDTLNNRFALDRDSFRVQLVENDSRRADRQIEIFMDDGGNQLEFVEFRFRIVDSLTSRPILSAFSILSSAIKKYRRDRGGYYVFDLAKPLPRSIPIQIREGQSRSLIKAVQIEIDEKRRTLPDVPIFLQDDIAVSGEVLIDQSPAANAVIHLRGNPKIRANVNPKGGFVLNIPGAAVQSTLDIVISYGKSRFSGQILPRTKTRGYSFSFSSRANVAQNSPEQEVIDPNLLTDPRDGQTYPTVNINGLTWMAKNLNYATQDSWCYLELPALCAKAGRLYTWEAAGNACPPGWRLPSDEEWSALETLGYNALIVGGELGFNALLGGYRSHRGEFLTLERDGDYWSGTARGEDNARFFVFGGDAQTLSRGSNTKALGFSCRCVQDN